MKIAKLWLIAICALASCVGVIAACTCPTPKIAEKTTRSSSACHKQLWWWTCEDESWNNGGCLAPNDQCFNCVEGPMTTPVQYGIFVPTVDSSGHCTCAFDHWETPGGQLKGIGQSTLCGVVPPDPTEN